MKDLPQTKQSELQNPKQHLRLYPAFVHRIVIFKPNHVLMKKEMKIKAVMLLTNLFLKANMTAPACSAAFPTIGSKMMLMKLTEIPQDSEASCKQ